jgi:hypothetical protein
MAGEFNPDTLGQSHLYAAQNQLITRSDYAFRVGKIIAVYYPDNELNYSGSFIEYDVLADHIDQFGMHCKVIYPRCTVMSLFGGTADFIDFTYRLSTTNASGQAQATSSGAGANIDYGSAVGILCVNGDVRQGYIIGGLKHLGLPQNDNFTPTEDAGVHLNFEFNGIVGQINDDGELTITFNGATQADGTLDPSADESNSGSNIKWSQDGSIAITSPSGNQSITQDNTSSQTTITADSQCNINSSGNVVIKSTGVLTGEATDNTLLGTSFREAQTVMDTSLSANFNALSGLIASAAVSLATAGASFAVAAVAGPALASAAASLASAAPLLALMGTAIDQFEAGSPSSYLSLKNQSD